MVAQEPKSCDITSEAFDMGVDEVNKRVTEAMQVTSRTMDVCT
jgi:hypothetical protein